MRKLRSILATIFGTIAFLAFGVGLFLNSPLAEELFYRISVERSKRLTIEKLEESPGWQHAKIEDIELFFRVDKNGLTQDRTEYTIRFADNPLDFILITDYDNDNENGRTANEILFGYGRSSLEPRNSMEGFLWLDLGEGSRPWLAGATMHRPEDGEPESSYLVRVFAKADILISYLSRIRFELDHRYVVQAPIP